MSTRRPLVVRSLPWLLAGCLGALSTNCAEETHSAAGCPVLPQYDAAFARAFVDAGAAATGTSVVYPWLTDAERQALETAERLGCITLPRRRFSLPKTAASSAQPTTDLDSGAAVPASSN
jgi:hypothetical protein